MPERAGRDIERAELIARMEEGEGAGPGAPETLEPTTGRPGAGGHGPPGPGGPTMAGMARRPDPRTSPRSAEADAVPDAAGVVGLMAFLAHRRLAERRERSAGRA